MNGLVGGTSSAGREYFAISMLFNNRDEQARTSYRSPQ